MFLKGEAPGGRRPVAQVLRLRDEVSSRPDSGCERGNLAAREERRKLPTGARKAVRPRVLRKEQKGGEVVREPNAASSE